MIAVNRVVGAVRSEFVPEGFMRTILIALLIVFSSSAFSSNTSGIAVGE